MMWYQLKFEEYIFMCYQFYFTWHLESGCVWMRLEMADTYKRKLSLCNPRIPSSGTLAVSRLCYNQYQGKVGILWSWNSLTRLYFNIKASLKMTFHLQCNHGFLESGNTYLEGSFEYVFIAAWCKDLMIVGTGFNF